LAREALAIARGYGSYDVVGFLDDSPALAGATVDGLPVLGTVQAVTAYPDAKLLVCAGRGVVRQRILERLDKLGVSRTRYATVIHPSVEIPDGCTIGAGSIVLAGVVATTAVTLGEHVVIMPNAVLTHDCVLEDYVTVCAGVVLGGNVIVQQGAYLGMNSSVREGVKVGAGATLGMGAALLSDLPSGETWVGVPARPLAPSAKVKL
jgi:sugar O-acyltransferase (sialic acid O-acetyltransferase NeuD family)